MLTLLLHTSKSFRSATIYNSATPCKDVISKSKNNHLLQKRNNSDHTESTERISKLIAKTGFCSRRDAEKLILDGRVEVDGKKLDSPAVSVPPTATIKIDGNILGPVPPTKLWAHYKERGVIVSHKPDNNGRPTVFEVIKRLGVPHCVSVGRLDVNSEGLLLLTNNGELARFLEHPSSGFERKYEVRAFGNITESKLNQLSFGMSIDGINYGPMNTVISTKHKNTGSNTWLEVSFTGGKNQQIRRVFEHLNLEVNRLIRVQYGPYQLSNLHIQPGEVIEVPLRDSLKAFLNNKKNEVKENSIISDSGKASSPTTDKKKPITPRVYQQTDKVRQKQGIPERKPKSSIRTKNR